MHADRSNSGHDTYYIAQKLIECRVVVCRSDTSRKRSVCATRFVFNRRTDMDRNAVVKVGAMASATVCALFGGVVFAQYIFTKKQRAGKKTKIIEMVRAHIFPFL